VKKKFLPAYLLTLVNVLGFSILMPILPFVVKSYGAEKWVYGLLISLYSFFQFIGAPWLGGLSDVKGRKPILLISQLGTLLSWIVFIFALSLPTYMVFGFALPLWVIALSRILDGVTGGNTSVANAYVSDITTREEKSYIFGYLGGIAGLGMIVGPGIGGLAASTSLGYAGTLLTAAIISTITLLAIIFWLKETHPEEKRAARKRLPLSKILFIPARVKSAQPSSMIKSLFTVKMLFSTMMGFYIGTIALYLIDTFHFNETNLGMFMFAVGVFLSFNQAIVSKFFVRKLGELKTLMIGLSLCVVGFFSITATTNIYLFIPLYYILNLGLSLCFPTFNALISVNAEPTKQGEIMGISESINSFAMAIFPVVSALLYEFLKFKLYFFVSALPFLGLVIAYVKLSKESHKVDARKQLK